MKPTATKRNQELLFGAAILSLALLGGCATYHAYLVPTPTDTLTNGGRAATATTDDVTITVTPNAWNGRPGDLYTNVTPLKIRIDNHRNDAIRVTYQDFDLKTPGGQTLAALPPFDIHGTQAASDRQVDPPNHRYVLAAAHEPEKDRPRREIGEVEPDFDWNGFYYAPYWNWGYYGIGPWPYWWGPDWGYWGAYYPYWSYRLPTRSMLRRAIPEGVITPNGYVSGFLYFQRVNPKIESVTFQAKLQDAKTGQQFGTIAIPFEVRSQNSY